MSIERTGVSAVLNVQKRIVVEEFNNQILTCSSAALLQLRTLPKKRFKHPLKTVHFSMLEIRTLQRIAHSGPQLVFWNDDSPAFPKSFLGLVQVLYDKIASSLKGSALVAHLVYACCLTLAMRWSDSQYRADTIWSHFFQLHVQSDSKLVITS